MSSESRAVFLSYASQDADAARKICEALRGAGVEVWLDQSELVGGDAWDAKIRKQIAECALFVPVISGATQARHEGYFRLEWKLAAQRTHMISERTAFLLPVVIDSTRDADADVPSEFRAVQWTRAPEGALSPVFVERVRVLLEGGGVARASPRVEETANTRGETRAISAPQKRASLRLWGALAGVVIIGAIATFIATRTKEPSAPADSKLLPSEATRTSTDRRGSGGMDPGTTQNPKPIDLASAKSIAVLPFTNLSDDKEANAFFADGIHEEILTNLALIAELRVVSRTSVLQYRTTTKSLPQIARELNVTYVLEGSVLRAAGKVRVTGQLIRAATDEHVWAKSYQKDMTDIFAIQAELAQSIATALKTAISPQEKKLMERRPTEDLAAYESYLRARAVLAIPTSVNRQRAETLAQAAVDLDPKFAEAWSILSYAHGVTANRRDIQSTEHKAKAKDAIDRAVSLAPDSPEVIRRLASYYQIVEGDYARAIEQAERLIRLQPNFGGGYYTLSASQRRQGRWAEAMANRRKAVQLDPGDEQMARGFLTDLMRCRRFDEANSEHRRIMALVPDRIDDSARLARQAFLARGSTRESEEFFSRLPVEQANSPRVIDRKKSWFADTGNFAEARRLDELQPYFDEDGSSRSLQAIDAAAVCLAVGDLPAARARLGTFPAELRARIEFEPGNMLFWSDLARMEAVLGNKTEALRCAHKAVELMPLSKDAISGLMPRMTLAVVQAWTGDKDAAVAELGRLLRVPSDVNVHELKSGSYFISLRGHPGFEALINDPKNNAPLF